MHSESGLTEALSKGTRLEELSKFLDAAAHYQTLLDKHPLNAELWYRTGAALRRGGEIDASLPFLEKASLLAPDTIEIELELGNALQQRRRLGEAVVAYNRVCAIDPENLSALTNKAIALHEGGHLEDALTALETATSLAPDDPVILLNLGTALLKKGRLSEALTRFQSAAELAPDYAEAWSSLAVALQAEHRYKDSLLAHEKALALAPNSPDIHWNRGITLLLLGSYTEGFREWEFRRSIPALRSREFPGEDWDGGEIEGKSILVHAEQGAGDTIQFARFLRILSDRGAHVIFSVHRGLSALAETVPGVSQVIVGEDAPPHYDCQVPLLSLATRLGIDLDMIPASIPYMSLPCGTVSPLPPANADRRIGLVWAGNPRHPNDHNRSCPFQEIQTLFSLSDIEWVNLQVGEQTEEAEVQFAGLTQPEKPLTNFMETAAAIRELDLVISVDTSVAHLAGALGHPVWILLPHAPDWRWMADRSDSPWYPTARLFRQSTPGNWKTVITDVSNALMALDN
jgi:tetratricopeptide (TPR) repeat protein